MKNLIPSWVGGALIGASLLLFIMYGMLPALLAGLTAYTLTTGLINSRWLKSLGRRTSLVASLLVALIPAVVCVVGSMLAYHWCTQAIKEMPALIQALASYLAHYKSSLPSYISTLVPDNSDTVRKSLAALLHSQYAHIVAASKTGLHGLLMALVGLIVGILIANHSHHTSLSDMPLAMQIRGSASRLHQAFLQIVVGQFWIASVNTALTAVFLFVVLPLMHSHMPQPVGLLVLTFCASMLPVVGNLLCNVVLTIVGLSVSPAVAIAALIFLILLHKFEYVLASKAIGSKTRIAVWEILAALFIAEAVFGVAGLVIAPLAYTWLRSELKFAQLV